MALGRFTFSFFASTIAILVTFSSVVNLAHANPSSRNLSCGGVFAELSTDGNFVDANGIMVTGEEFYPLNDVVLPNLNFLKSPPAPGSRVVDIGAGFSALTSYLRSRGVEATAIDVWYNNSFPNNEVGRLMQQYVLENAGHFISGSAFNLPLADNSVDMAVSHQFLNNLEDPKQILQAVKEALRITRPGGEIRIYGLETQELDELLSSLSAQERAAATAVRVEVNYTWRGRAINLNHYLLTIVKPAQKGTPILFATARFTN